MAILYQSRRCWPVELNWWYDRLTPLHIAAQHGHSVTVQTLLAAGPHIEATKLGAIALHAGAYCRHMETVQALLAAGANVRVIPLIGHHCISR